MKIDSRLLKQNKFQAPHTFKIIIMAAVQGNKRRNAEKAGEQAGKEQAGKQARKAGAEDALSGAAFRERVDETVMCPICHGTVTDALVASCCGKSVCGLCVAEWEAKLLKEYDDDEPELTRPIQLGVPCRGKCTACNVDGPSYQKNTSLDQIVALFHPETKFSDVATTFKLIKRIHNDFNILPVDPLVPECVGCSVRSIGNMTPSDSQLVQDVAVKCLDFVKETKTYSEMFQGYEEDGAVFRGVQDGFEHAVSPFSQRCLSISSSINLMRVNGKDVKAPSFFHNDSKSAPNIRIIELNLRFKYGMHYTFSYSVVNVLMIVV